MEGNEKVVFPVKLESLLMLGPDGTGWDAEGRFPNINRRFSADA